MSAGPVAIPRGGSPRTVLFFYSVGLAGRLLLLIGMVLVLIDELDHELRSPASRDGPTKRFIGRSVMGVTGSKRC